MADFCVRDELFEVLTGLESYSFSDEQIRADRYPWFRHRRLRPLAFAVEQMARGILETARLPQRGDTMPKLFAALARGAPWETEFKALLDSGYTNERSRPFEQQVTLVLAMARPGDPEHLIIARTIILAIIARNIAGHRHREVAVKTVNILGAICGRALVMTWLLAHRAALI